MPNNNNHHDNNIRNQQNIPPNENSMMLTEEDDTISDYDYLKMINLLPFNMDDHGNIYQRERTMSENTLIALQHLWKEEGKIWIRQETKNIFLLCT